MIFLQPFVDSHCVGLQVALTVGQHFADPMHTARGGWLGQTYALAKFDDGFDGKKSGIRRSKEERKGMIVTFIKRCFHFPLVSFD